MPDSSAGVYNPPVDTQQSAARCPQCGQSFPATVRICPNDGTVLEHVSPTAARLGVVLDGKYRLDRFLSHGGMGSVYEATHVMLLRKVAVKLINPEIVTSPEIVRRFQREARAATTLNHPNITAVYDLGQTSDGTLYIAMEYVDGPTLKAALSRGPMPATRIVWILRQVASALSAAHRHGIVHRDLKPQNIMLAHDDHGVEIAKLVDFGIAKTFEEGTQLTQTGFALGTPQYMAPEQAEGKPVDGRSDLYSLGIILYEMLVGVAPFTDASTPAILIKHIKETPVLPSIKNPGASPALEAIAMRCLEKDPAARFQTADDVLEALNGVPVDPDATVSFAAGHLAATVRNTAMAATTPGTPGGPNPTVKLAPTSAVPPTRPTVMPVAATPTPVPPATATAQRAVPAPAVAWTPQPGPAVVAAAVPVTAPVPAIASAAESAPAALAAASTPVGRSSRGPVGLVLGVAAVLLLVAAYYGYALLSAPRATVPPSATARAESAASAAPPSQGAAQTSPSPAPVQGEPQVSVPAPPLPAPIAVVAPPTPQQPAPAETPHSAPATTRPVAPRAPATTVTAAPAPSAAVTEPDRKSVV
jgi:hypothetical protein